MWMHTWGDFLMEESMGGLMDGLIDKWINCSIKLVFILHAFHQ